MAGSREIRNKIRSVQSTRKITKAMEMVAASKMKKAQERMRASRPYVQKMLQIAGHIAHANPEYKHPFLVERAQQVRNAAMIVVTSDKGLCGGLNTNVLRMAYNQIKQWQSQGVGVQVTAIGNKALGFMQRAGVRVVSHAVQLGDRPRIEQVIGPVKVQLDDYVAGKIDTLHIITTRFVNTMKQDAFSDIMLPLHKGEFRQTTAAWDYIYEADAKTVLDALLVRYIEAVVYQAVNESMASEQSARMVAMKAASDNAGDIIDELTLIYNKTRQAAITKELSEIVGGAAAV